MKKVFALVLFICLLICLCGCNIAAMPPVYEVNGGAASATLPSFERETRPTGRTHHRDSDTSDETVDESILSIAYSNTFSYRDENGIIRAIGIVQVTNNSDTALSLLPCTMTFTDENGETVYSSDSVDAYPPVIAPSESAYYYEQFEPDLPDSSALSLAPVISEPVPAESVRYEVGEIAINDSPYGGLVLNSTVKNTTDQDGEVVCIAAVLFAQDGTPLAVVYTVLMDPLPAGQSTDFYIEDFLLPATITADSVASVQTFAYPL